MELLERFAKGDRDAFEILFGSFQADVYAWILRIVREPAAAEDVLIEAFWRMWRARVRFDHRREFGPWARRIATNAALGHLKNARRETPLDADPPVLAAAACDGEDMECIRAAFAKLPPKLRAVATLAIIEERPYAEIAVALDISVAAVKSREFRAVRQLRRRLAREGIEP